ncbi:MAG: NlpC/P60 family protein, partial [Pseudonocardia sp.]|nr:NlpC/P60 family protein [Pseudonocardia sp.]
MNQSRTTVALATAAAALLVLGAMFLIGVPMLVIGTGALAGGGCDGDGGPGGGSQQIGPRDYNAEQAENAQTIVTTALARQLPQRAAVIAISTALVESQLRNLGHGDRDSL